MAVCSVTYSFSASTLAKSAEVNTDFSDLVSFINNQVIQKDGSLAATAHLSGPATDPTASTQYANKQYVDRLGLVARESLTSNTAAWSATTDTDLNLDNVSVVAGRTYEVHLHTQYTFSSVGSNAAWSVNLKLNGSQIDRFAWIQPVQVGVIVGTIDSKVFWTPSVTASTDDLLVSVTLQTTGATLQFNADASAKRTLSLIDLGVLG